MYVYTYPTLVNCDKIYYRRSIKMRSSDVIKTRNYIWFYELTTAIKNIHDYSKLERGRRREEIKLIKCCQLNLIYL